MDENVMSQLDAELEHAGEETALSPQMLLLEQLRITPEKELPKMEFLFRLFGKPCFPRRELVAITGKAKSGKTFVTSMLMACCKARDILHFHRETEQPLHVMWYDTEQSDESTQDILKNRIIPMMSYGNEVTTPLALWRGAGGEAFNVRSVEWKQRRALLMEAVRRSRPDLVIVDGIRDLVNDINDGVLAQEVMEELLHLATQVECCIVCVLHQNKGSEDHNLRGWIGTELMNKAFEVYSCEKLMPQRVFKLEQTLTRKYDIDQAMYFEVGEDGLPKGASPLLPSAEGEKRGGQERLPPLNRDYIVESSDDKRGWHFDVERIIADAMNGEGRVQAKILRERVMTLTHIQNPNAYNAILHEAIDRKLILQTQEGRLTFYEPAPF